MTVKVLGATTPHGLTTPVLLALGMVAILGPLGSDVFLPGLPVMSESLGSTAEQLQLTLSAFTVGLALGQLVAGPLSDAVGRRTPLLLGTTAAAIGGIGAAFSPSLPLLVLACLVMGLGTSFGAGITRAMISDLATGPDQLTRGFALLNTLGGIGPVIAPLLGVAFMALWGWRGIFAGYAAVCLLSLLAALYRAPESLAREVRVTGGLRVIPSTVARAFRSRPFLCGAFVAWFGFAASWAYIAGSSYIVQTVLGFDATVYAITFAVNGIGLMAAGFIVARLAARLTDQQIIPIGLGLLSLGSLLVGASAIVSENGGSPSPWLVLPGLFCFASAIAFYLGPAMGLAVRELRSTAGTALALVGAVQFLVASIISPLTALGGGASLAPFAILVAAATVAAWLSWMILRDGSHQSLSLAARNRES